MMRDIGASLYLLEAKNFSEGRVGSNLKERNKLHAQRTRLRKNMYRRALESLKFSLEREIIAFEQEMLKGQCKVN